MKKWIVIILIVVGLWVADKSGVDLVPDGVNRSTTWHYGTDLNNKYIVYVDFESGFAYHDFYRCYETSKIKEENLTTKMSEYEAIQRGFFPCPYCY